MDRSALLSLLAGVALAAGGALSAPAPPAAAEACPDVEVMFARGTGEQPGLGANGQLFVDALRGMLGARSLGAYAVDYPASRDWPTGVAGIRTPPPTSSRPRRRARRPKSCSAASLRARR